MNPCVVPVRNNVDLTKKAVKSILAQDIPVDLLVIDNQSTDGTSYWAATRDDFMCSYFNPPLSVAASWNYGLKYFFDRGAEYCLVANNDIELRPDTYRLLVEDGGPFVTAVGVREWPPEGPMSSEKRPHPDFSCYLIRREVYESVGKFNEMYKIAYCEDSEYHVRMHQKGIHAYCIDLPFLHHGAQTVKHSNPAETLKIKLQADKNRKLFKSTYGFGVGSEEYYRWFGSTAPPA